MSSSALSKAADQLLKRSNSIMSEPYRTQVHNAVLYVHSLDESFAEVSRPVFNIFKPDKTE
jgi:hypothetical protein